MKYQRSNDQQHMNIWQNIGHTLVNIFHNITEYINNFANVDQPLSKCGDKIVYLRKNWIWNNARVRKSCRYPKMLQDKSLLVLANSGFGFDTAHSEPSEVMFLHFLSPYFEIQVHRIRVLISRPESRVGHFVPLWKNTGREGVLPIIVTTYCSAN